MTDKPIYTPYTGKADSDTSCDAAAKGLAREIMQKFDLPVSTPVQVLDKKVPLPRQKPNFG